MYKKAFNGIREKGYPLVSKIEIEEKKILEEGKKVFHFSQVFRCC